MQHKYFLEAEVDRIDLEDGEWVDIKRRMTVADQDLLGEKVMHVEIDPTLSREQRRRKKQAGEFPGSARFKPSTVAVLETSIVAWSFTYPDGTPVPLNTEMIGRMDPILAHQLEEEIDERNPLDRPLPSNTETHLKEDPQPSPTLVDHM